MSFDNKGDRKVASAVFGRFNSHLSAGRKDVTKHAQYVEP